MLFRSKEAARAAGLDYGAMIHSPADPPSRILDFCTGKREMHVALLRGELPDSLFGYLQSAGIRVINPASAVALARDKLTAAAFFGSIGARHPRTLLQAAHPAPLPGAQSAALPRPFSLPFSLPLSLPFVAKPRYGKMGRGVALIKTEEQWSLYLAEARYTGQETIVQEFIGAAAGRDIRFFFADFETRPSAEAEKGTGGENGPEVRSGMDNGSTAGWVCVMRSAPGFLSNAHAGGTMTSFDPTAELRREAERIFAASGLVYGTVDFLFSNESGSEFVVCELNANPGFEELERSTGIDVASAILATVTKNSALPAFSGTVSRRAPGSGKDGTP